MALTGAKAFPNWELLAHEVENGDVLLIDGWYQSDANTMAKFLYQQAAYQKAALPAGTDANSAPALLTLLQGHDQAVRFLAVRALGSLSDTTQGDALTAIAANDADWVVQKEAVVALGRLKHAAAIPVLQKLTNDPFLGYFATAALHDMQTR
jgi:HEAT repeat protein